MMTTLIFRSQLQKEAGFTIPSWMTIQNVFSQSKLIYSLLPSCLELTEVKFLQFRVNSCFEHGTNHPSLTAWPMLNVYDLKLGKVPDLAPHNHSTEQQACDCIAMPPSLIPSKPLIVEFAISNLLYNVYVQWPMSTHTCYL